MDWKGAVTQTPKQMGGNYFKFLDGVNKFRILSEPITGYLYWTTDNKPVRVKDYPDTVPSNIRDDSKIRFFWAFIVWSYRENKIQILEVTQTSIQNALGDLVLNEDWGDPKGYDITVTRKGEKLDTEYTVQPSPAKPLSPAIASAYEHKDVKLEALFEGKDPFASDAEVAANSF